MKVNVKKIQNNDKKFKGIYFSSSLSILPIFLRQFLPGLSSLPSSQHLAFLLVFFTLGHPFPPSHSCYTSLSCLLCSSSYSYLLHFLLFLLSSSLLSPCFPPPMYAFFGHLAFHLNPSLPPSHFHLLQRFCLLYFQI